MKTAKKIFSLLLVAVLMLSAIPFQAFATGETTSKTAIYQVNFRVNSGDTADQKVGTVSGSSVTIPLPSNPTAPAGKVFAGWKLNTDPDVRTNWVLDISAFPTTPTASNETANIYALGAIAVFTDAPHSHDFSVELPETRTQDTCTTAATMQMECSDVDCTEKTTVTVGAPLGHRFVTYTADALGVQETATCENGCGTIDTRYKDYTVRFHDQKLGTVVELTLHKNQTIPTLPERTGDDVEGFMGWFDVTNKQIRAGGTWAGDYLDYYAKYEETIHTTQSKVKVYYQILSENVAIEGAKYLGYDITLPNNTASLLSAVRDNSTGIYNALVAKGLTSDKYELRDDYYVYNTSTGNVTSLAGNVTVNSDTAVLVRLDAKEVVKTMVTVEVHKKVGDAGTVYTMDGYKIGDTVYLSHIQNLLNSKGKNGTITEFYTHSEWQRKVSGISNVNGTNLYTIDSNVLRLHVIAPNYVAGGTTTSNKPASNPATGDTIMITAGIMALSAAAFVALTQLRKRKMI